MSGEVTRAESDAARARAFGRLPADDAGASLVEELQGAGFSQAGAEEVAVRVGRGRSIQQAATGVATFGEAGRRVNHEAVLRIAQVREGVLRPGSAAASITGGPVGAAFQNSRWTAEQNERAQQLVRRVTSEAAGRLGISAASALEAAKAKLSECEKAAIAASEGVDGLLRRFESDLVELQKLPSIPPAGPKR